MKKLYFFVLMGLILVDNIAYGQSPSFAEWNSQQVPQLKKGNPFPVFGFSVSVPLFRGYEQKRKAAKFKLPEQPASQEFFLQEGDKEDPIAFEVTDAGCTIIVPGNKSFYFPYGSGSSGMTSGGADGGFGGGSSGSGGGGGSDGSSSNGGDPYICIRCIPLARAARVIRDRTIENAYIEMLEGVGACVGTGTVLYQFLQKHGRLNPYAPVLTFLLGSGCVMGSWAIYSNKFDIANAEFDKAILECPCQ